MPKNTILAAVCFSFLTATSWAETQLFKCSDQDGKIYYADAPCEGELHQEQLALRKITRLDPLPENPMIGLTDYYGDVYKKLLGELEKLGIKP